MSETTAENKTSTEAPAGASESATQGELNLDDTTGLDVPATDNNLVDGKATETKEPPKEEPKSEVKETTKEEPTPKEEAKDEDEKPEPEAKTLDELGYSDVRADQVALAELATEMGVSHDDLKGAIVEGKLDTSKLEGLTPRDSQLLKTTVEAEVAKLNNEKATRRTELYNHAGSEDNFKAMVEWANSKSATDAKFKSDVSELRSMMVEGGKRAEVAVKDMFNQFKADPATSLASSGTTGTAGDVDAGLSKRDKLDAGWTALKNKYK